MMSESLMLTRYVFQELHPISGVEPSAAARMIMQATNVDSKRIFLMSLLFLGYCSYKVGIVCPPHGLKQIPQVSGEPVL